MQFRLAFYTPRAVRAKLAYWHDVRRDLQRQADRPLPVWTRKQLVETYTIVGDMISCLLDIIEEPDRYMTPWQEWERLKRGEAVPAGRDAR